MTKKKKSKKVPKGPHKVANAMLAGGVGKTTFTANPSMMLAEKGYRVLMIGGCPSNQLALYFNVGVDNGLHSFLAGEDLGELLWEVRPNLYLLPAGDLVEAESILREDKVFPAAQLEEKLADWEENFDFIFFDMAPNSNTLLFFNIMFYVDTILSPVETHRRGFDKLVELAALLESKNHNLRKRHGKSELKINFVIPNKHQKTLLNRDILALLKEEFGDAVTEPVGLCTGVAHAWKDSQSLSERIDGMKTPRKNEVKILSIMEELVENLIQG